MIVGILTNNARNAVIGIVGIVATQNSIAHQKATNVAGEGG